MDTNGLFYRDTYHLLYFVPRSSTCSVICVLLLLQNAEQHVSCACLFLGFMLCFGDLTWVPFTYALQTRYLFLSVRISLLVEQFLFLLT